MDWFFDSLNPALHSDANGSGRFAPCPLCAGELVVMCFKFQKTLNKDNKHEDNDAVTIRAYHVFTTILSGGDIGYRENNDDANRNDECLCQQSA